MAKWKEIDPIVTVEISPYHSIQGPESEVTYGQRKVVKMYNDISRLRSAIRREGTPAVQEAWDRVEQHIDYVYGRARDVRTVGIDGGDA